MHFVWLVSQITMEEIVLIIIYFSVDYIDVALADETEQMKRQVENRLRHTVLSFFLFLFFL